MLKRKEDTIKKLLPIAGAVAIITAIIGTIVAHSGNQAVSLHAMRLLKYDLKEGNGMNIANKLTISRVK